MHRGKKFVSAVATIERSKLYGSAEAIDVVKATAFAKFDEGVDIAVHLGVDPRHADQIVRGPPARP